MMAAAPKKTAKTATTTKTPKPDAAAAESDYHLVFRGHTFDIPRARVRSLHFAIAANRGNAVGMMTETLSPVQGQEFLLLVDRGEPMQTVIEEFMTALSAALRADGVKADV